jgi:hypothetical protein
MRKGIENLVIRNMNARARLVACLAEVGGISLADADKVATLYLSKKIRAAKLDPIGGEFRMIDGRFMDRVVIERALLTVKG